MHKLSTKLKRDILNILWSEKDIFLESYTNNIINILDDLFDLRSLESLDSRYSNAYDDAYQHLINNDDWDYDYVFTQRFNILSDNDVFIRFLNSIIHPNNRKDEDEIIKFTLLINPYLIKEKLSYRHSAEYIEDVPVYIVDIYTENNSYFNNIPENKIPFIFIKEPGGWASNTPDITQVDTFPAFVLNQNNDWNDYSNFSSSHLFYFDTNKECYEVGAVKIINKNSKSTRVILSERFYTLDESYCSLGTTFEYYENLKNIFKKGYKSVLWALKDAAIFTEIADSFENEYYFQNSLIRYDEQEILLREAKYRLYNYNLENLYSFKYRFSPKYTKDQFEIEFDFDINNTFSNRIYALTGKNGVGKTQLISSLPIDISRTKDDFFTPKTPMFGKVITVSYSVFDSFEIPKKNEDFNYAYCGLKSDKKEQLSNKALRQRFHRSFKELSGKERFHKWKTILLTFINIDLIDEMLNGDNSINLNGFDTAIKKFSSGQSILFYIITEIIANIRYGSLIIYDEPETHLHPNAISQLMNTLFELTKEFKSFCILATHSPLIVRELFSKNVYILERNQNHLSIRKPIQETFGENLTIITEDIFGNNTIPKHFKKVLNQLVEQDKSFEEVLSIIESKDIPSTLNVRLYLKSILNEKS